MSDGSAGALAKGNRPVIEPARRADLAGLPELERAAARRFALVPGLERLAEGPVTPLETFEQARERGCLWVARIDGQVRGFALCRRPPESDGARRTADLHLHEMDVDPDYGRRGLGRALVSAIEAEARSRARGEGNNSGRICPRLSLITFRDVPWNGPFYRRLGFRPLPEEQWGSWLQRLWRQDGQAGLDPSRREMLAKDL